MVEADKDNPGLTFDISVLRRRKLTFVALEACRAPSEGITCTMPSTAGPQNWITVTTDRNMKIIPEDAYFRLSGSRASGIGHRVSGHLGGSDQWASCSICISWCSWRRAWVIAADFHLFVSSRVTSAWTFEEWTRTCIRFIFWIWSGIIKNGIKYE